MTITSCRRLDYFIRSMDSFFENMLDWRMLNRITCCDDNSSHSDRDIMIKRYPDIEFIWSDKIGHPYSIKKLFGRLTSEFVLHWEDDFILITKGDLITKCLAVFADYDVSSIILTHNHGERRTSLFGEYFLKMYDERVAKACPRECGFNRELGQPMNPGFSLNPGLHRTSALKSIEWPVCKNHEYMFAKLYHDANYRVAYFGEWYVKHIGDISSFCLNGTER